MKQLWAPWRSEYVNSGGGSPFGKEPECFFCSLPKKADEKGGVSPTETLILFNGPLTTVMLNKYPYNNGHLLVAPVRHLAKFEELTPTESIDSFRMLKHSIDALTKKMKPDGFNIGINLGRAAGAGVEDHMHWHVVPRWHGDVNFMPVMSEVKVMPQHLQETLELLLPLFERLD